MYFRFTALSLSFLYGVKIQTLKNIVTSLIANISPKFFKIVNNASTKYFEASA